MKFVYLVHPLASQSAALLRLDAAGALRANWGGNILQLCLDLHAATESFRAEAGNDPAEVRVVDRLSGLVSAAGARADGRLYEVPMDVRSILADPGRALAYMEQAIDAAAAWGASLVGLGSMTGVVGGQGQHLAQRGPLRVTTGNSLTVFAAMQSLELACVEADLDLRHETVAVIGIPGSIAAASARWLARRRCRRLLLVGRRPSPRPRDWPRNWPPSFSPKSRRRWRRRGSCCPPPPRATASIPTSCCPARW